jgi:hypothetical protein
MLPRPGRPLETDEDSFQRRLVLSSVLASVVVALGCFWPLLLGRHFLYADLGNFHLPLRLFYAEGLAAGAIPLWLPNLFCGYFLHAEGQVGMYHPVHLLLYSLLSPGAAFALECTLAFPFTFVGMTLFLRRFRVPLPGAVCGGAALGFSTFLLVRYTHVNVVAVIAHTPWLLLLVDIATRTRRAVVFRRCCAGIALLVASQVLLGYPGAVVFSLLYVTLYELYLLRELRDPLRLAWLFVAGGLGLLIGAVQWLPTFELFGLSNRANGSLEERFAQFLHPWNLLQPLAPYLFRQRVFQIGPPNPIEQSLYLGAAFPVLLAWLVARRTSLGKTRRLLTPLAVVGGLSILFALGPYGGLLAWVSQLPLVGQLRVPARFTLFLHFLSSIALALAFTDLLRVSRAPDAGARAAARWLWLAPLASAAIAVGALLLAASSFAPIASGERLSDPRAIWLGPALSIACAAICAAIVRGHRFALALLVPFIAADQAGYATSLWWTVPPVSIEAQLASVPRLGGGEGRVAMGYSSAARADATGKVFYDASTRYIVHGDRLIWGYAGLMPRRSLRPYSPEAIAIAGVTVRLNGRERILIDAALPRFRLVDRVRVGTDPPRDLAGLDLRTTALVSRPVAVEVGAPGKVELLGERSGAIRLSVRAPTRQLLVIAESHHPGWQLRIDGAPAPIERVYGDFMGAVIEAGEHRVALDFAPRSVAIGRLLSLTGLGMLGALYALLAWRDRSALRVAAPC